MSIDTTTKPSEAPISTALESTDDDDNKTLVSSTATPSGSNSSLEEKEPTKPTALEPPTIKITPSNATAVNNKDDEEDAEVDLIRSTSPSSKTTSFPKKFHFQFTSDETQSNTNANANTFIEARDVARRRRKRQIERTLYHEQHPDDVGSHHHHHHHHHEHTDQPDQPADSVHDAAVDSSSDSSSDSEDSDCSTSRSRSHSRVQRRSRSRARKLSGGGLHNEGDLISPAHDFEPRVAFDTFDNKLAIDFSLTLRFTHQDYKYSRLSRTFLCGTDKNKYSENAASWLMRELVEDGDEIVCLRVVEPGSNEKTYRKEAESFLAHLLTKNVKNKAISVILEFSVGKIQDTIMRMMEVYEPSVLVVGTKGRSIKKGFRGLLPGSVSKWCLQHSPIPVIVVKPPNLREQSKGTRLATDAADRSQYAHHRQSYLEMIASADNLDTVKIYGGNNSSSPNLHPNLPPYLTTHSSLSNPTLSRPKSAAATPTLTSPAFSAMSGNSGLSGTSVISGSPLASPRLRGSPLASPKSTPASLSAPSSPLLLSSGSPSLHAASSDRKISRLDLLRSKSRH